MTDGEFQIFVETANAELRKKQTILADDYGFGSAERWWFEPAEVRLAQSNRTQVAQCYHRCSPKQIKAMPNYRRAFIPGGTWFFTANLLQRHHNDLLIREISLLRETVRRVRERHPFQIDAWVVLPEHLHCVWTLPSRDSP